MKRISLIFLVALFAAGLMAQTGNPSGTIRGRMIDASTGEPLIGANVFITGTTIGTITDYDGNFSLPGIKPGIVSVTASYVSYETQVFEDVEVPEGDVVILNGNLSISSQELQEVVITARRREKTETAVLVMKKKMPSVLDGISSQQISRLGDSNAAAALKRVTGVSVEGGKYVYVRGLSDRYSTTTLNGAQIPGLDPEKNTVQMDLFPSNIIENLMVYKTFAPDQPATSTGGLVNIYTKDFPEKFTLQFSAELGYNSQSNLRHDFLTYAGGSKDWLGIDDGTRAIPDAIDVYTKDGQIPYLYQNNDTLDLINKSFNGNLDNLEKYSLPDMSYSFSTGNQYKLFGRALGFNVAANYSHKYNMYRGGDYQKTTSPLNIDKPNLKVNFNDDFALESTIWSVLGNLAYKLNNNNMIGFTFMRNQSGDASSRFNKGNTTDPDTYDVEEKALGWLERSITSYQAKGKHVFPWLANGSFDWMVSSILSTQDEPDLRFFKSDYFKDREAPFNYEMRPNNLSARFYRYMTESNLDAKFNYSQPFNIAGRKAKFKTGYAYIDKERDSDESKYTLDFQGAIRYDGMASTVLVPENFLETDSASYLYYENSLTTEAVNSYRAYQTVHAGYGMFDLPVTDNFRLVAGVRYEYSDVFIENKVDTIAHPSDASKYGSGGFRDGDFLPSVNMTYAITENINLRFGYNKTLARPVFRELAPYASYNYKENYRVVGNPDLQRTIIQNLDFRWEWYPSSGELVSASAFYKDFKNPIELRDVEQAANPEIHVENIEEARLYGLEFEIRKNLDFLHPLRNFSVGTNLTLVKSIVKEDSTKLSAANIALARQNPDGGDRWPETRPMYGQSPYIVNAYLNYFNADRGWDMNLGFNVSGKKIILINKAAIPNVMEQPFAKLDFNISKNLKNGISFKFSAENLINPYYEQTLSFNNGKEVYFRRHKLGRQFSFGITYAIN
jgi:TonB-dependent receptor